MSERAGRGGGRGGSRGARGGATSSGSRGANDNPQEQRKREAILDLAKYANKRIRVKFSGGREIEGVLKGWDQLLNLVMDDVEELVRDPVSLQAVQPEQRRNLGLALIRGIALVIINPVDGFESIANPFTQQED